MAARMLRTRNFFDTPKRETGMGQLYRIHFGTSKRSKFYPQALELATLAIQHEVRGEGTDVWHIVSLSDGQLDLMHRLYLLSRKLPPPKFHGIDPLSLHLACEPDRLPWFKPSPRVQEGVRQAEKSTGKSGADLAAYISATYIDPIRQDGIALTQKLEAEGCLNGFDYATKTPITATRPMPEPLTHIKKIRELITAGNGTAAVAAYYESLGNKFYGELTGELIYLKRLFRIPLAGRDLLYFRSESSRDFFVRQNLAQYVDCIDATLARNLESGQRPPLEILLEHAPTMEQMIKAKKHEWHFGAYLLDGEIKRDSSKVSEDTFSRDSCPEGRLFNRYPDQIQHCRVGTWVTDSEYNGVWTLYTPAFCEEKVYSCGLHINMIDAYYPKAWRRRFNGLRQPAFTACVSLNDIEKSSFGTDGIKFTGRQHAIEAKLFYEIDLVRHQKASSLEVENPFLQLVEELLREAENLLRERHGLPRIGEGWFAEMQMFRLIEKIFPDAQLRSRPEWLSPQHLDCYVPSINAGFEYQGQQHFRVSAFFGGEEGLLRTQLRDKIKAEKCQANGVTLIYWLHNELLSTEVLLSKLAASGIKV